MKKIRILLTGGTGFIGHHLLNSLRELGHEVLPLVQQKSDMRQQIKGETYGDLTDYHRLYSIVKSFRPQVVYHLAAITPVRLSFDMPLKYQHVNYIGTCNLIHACLEVLGNEFRGIFASSAEVYGENGEIVNTENSPLKPMSPYAVSKVAADNYVQMCQAAYGLEAVVLRSNNTYGRPYSGYFVEQRMEELIPNKEVKLYNANHFRDYIFFPDHVLAYLTVLDKGQGIYNVSHGELISNLAMVRKMKEVIGSTSEIVEVDPPKNRPMDHRGINMDSGLLRTLGWEPKYTREEGITLLHDMYSGKESEEIMREALERAGL